MKEIDKEMQTNAKKIQKIETDWMHERHNLVVKNEAIGRQKMTKKCHNILAEYLEINAISSGGEFYDKEMEFKKWIKIWETQQKKIEDIQALVQSDIDIESEIRKMEQQISFYEKRSSQPRQDNYTLNSQSMNKGLQNRQSNTNTQVPSLKFFKGREITPDKPVNLSSILMKNQTSYIREPSPINESRLLTSNYLKQDQVNDGGQFLKRNVTPPLKLGGNRVVGVTPEPAQRASQTNVTMQSRLGGEGNSTINNNGGQILRLNSSRQR